MGLGWGQELGGALGAGEDCRGRVGTCTFPSITAGKDGKAPWAPLYLRPVLNQKSINPFWGETLGMSCSRG